MMSSPLGDPVPVLWVVCLCAQWCGTCRDYRPVFEGLEADFLGRANFFWVDIEDQAEMLGTVDVEDFPTVLIAHSRFNTEEVQTSQVLFFGPVLPLRGTLHQLIERATVGPLIEEVDHSVLMLAQRLALLNRASGW